MRCIAALLISLMLAACGGAGSSVAASASGAAVNTLTGVAAVGAAINGRIYVIDANGHDRYADTSDGQFSFNLSGMKAPLLLKVQWVDADGSHRLYSFSNADGVANITPLTHMVVSAAAANQSLDALYDAPSAAAFQALQDALPEAIAHLQAALKPLMASHAVEQVNPITHRFAANHTGMDALLDSIAVRFAGNIVTLTDRASGALLMVASCANLASAVTATQWTAADAMQATEIDAAVNASGVGMVVWTELASGHMLLKSRLMNGLDTGHTLSTMGHAASPHVGFDAGGNALAVWAQTANGRSEIWGSHYNAASNAWSAARRLSAASAGAGASLPDMALDQAGNGVVVWQQSDGRATHWDGWSAQYAAATGAWTQASRVTDGFNSAHGLHVALNAAGQGLVAWKQERGDGSSSGMPLDVWARSISTLGVWGSSKAIGANAAYVFGPLAVAANGSGGGTVLWSQRSLPALPMVIEAAMLSATSGWQAATAINQDGTDDCYSPRVAFDSAGNALAVWQQQSNFSAYGATNRYVAGVGWSAATYFVDAQLGDAFAPALAMDGAGNATVVWFRWSSNNAIDMMLNRYQTASGWTGAQVLNALGTDSRMLRLPPRAASNARGQTVVVWGQNQSAAVAGI